MDRDAALIQLKARLEEYLTSKGINTRHSFRCLNPAHNDSTPSMKYYADSNSVFCHGCRAKYDIADLIGMDYNLSAGEALERGYSMYHIPIDDKGPSITVAGVKINMGNTPPAAPAIKAPPAPPAKPQQDYSEYIEACHKRIGDTTYHSTTRGLCATTKRFKLGFDPAFTAWEDNEDGTKRQATWQALIIPNGPYSYTARNTDPAASKANRIRKAGASLPFNLKALDSGSPVFIVEGEIDALSVLEAGGEAIGLGSTANRDSLLKTLDKHKPQQPLILALDKDEAGQAAEKALMEGLERLGIPYIQADISGAYKDANEAFMGDTIAFITAVNAAQQSIKAALQDEQDIKRREYMGTSAAGHMAAFRDVVASSINTKPVSTGFAALDRALDGGVYEGLIFIGGITSSGKTTLALQMADSMAMQGQDVLIFSLEMARYELMAKSISRLTLRNCLLNKRDTSNAKTTRDVLSGARQALFSKEERALYEQACRQYEDYAEHLYISEGMGDIGVNEIRATIQKHITFTGSKPAVLIDYLQLLAPYNERYTDKQNTDKAVLELKRISRDFKVPVLAVSSLNRASYKNSIDLEAFKESGAIEYSSDVLLGLQYEGTGDDNFDRDKQAMAKQRKMELKVLKQRNAPKGMSIQLDYYAFANYFHEKIGQ